MTYIRKNPASSLFDFLSINPFKKFPPPFSSPNVIFTMNGRNAIYHALKLFSIKQNSTALLPAYHCTALVDPFISFGTNVKYYNVNKDLSVNFDEIEKLIDSDVSALLYVHFFGFPAPAKLFAELGKKYNILIIEDCTHTLFGKIGNEYMGTFGDASVFSFRKIVSTKDGGALVLNRNVSDIGIVIKNAPLLYQLRIAKWTFENPNWQLENNHNNSKKNKGSNKPDIKNNKIYFKKGPDSQEDENFYIEYVDWSISLISKILFKQVNNQSIYNIRRSNFNYIDSKLKKIDGIKPCFSFLPEGICPLGYPFIFEHSSRLDYILRKNGIPAFSFGEHLHQSVNQVKYSDAHYLSNHMLLLPVHHQLKKKHLDIMCEVIKRVSGEI